MLSCLATPMATPEYVILDFGGFGRRKKIVWAEKSDNPDIWKHCACHFGTIHELIIKFGLENYPKGYSDSENPFGDSELSQQFVWKKKEQRDGFAGLEEHEKLIYNQDELAKVRQSRLDRQFIRKVNDEEFSKVQKAKEEEYYAEWERKSTEMNKKQVWLRSKIRLENSNAKPIDWLAYFVATENIEEANECKQYMHTPQQIIHVIHKLFPSKSL